MLVHIRRSVVLVVAGSHLDVRLRLSRHRRVPAALQAPGGRIDHRQRIDPDRAELVPDHVPVIGSARACSRDARRGRPVRRIGESRSRRRRQPARGQQHSRQAGRAEPRGVRRATSAPAPRCCCRTRSSSWPTGRLAGSNPTPDLVTTSGSGIRPGYQPAGRPGPDPHGVPGDRALRLPCSRRWWSARPRGRTRLHGHVVHRRPRSSTRRWPSSRRDCDDHRRSRPLVPRPSGRGRGRRDPSRSALLREGPGFATDADAGRRHGGSDPAVHGSRAR